MRHHIYHILKAWSPQRDAGQWLLATIISTRGSAYRKAGAMMLFSDAGAQFGVVSGGCLESDLFHHARKCWMTNTSRTVTYDMQEEGDVAWQLGIGCGGEVTLLLQPVSEQNGYLHLPQILDGLDNNQTVSVCHRVDNAHAQIHLGEPPEPTGWFSHSVSPPNTLFIAGGGVDAVPVAHIADTLGWQVAVNDERARYARNKDFPAACQCLEYPVAALKEQVAYQQAQAIVVMHHQVELDARFLASVAAYPPPYLKYLCLLGPVHRTERVLAQAGIAADTFPVPLQSPAGFNIGGDLPESIALSMLSQAHAALYDKPYAQSSYDWQCDSA